MSKNKSKNKRNHLLFAFCFQLSSDKQVTDSNDTIGIYILQFLQNVYCCISKILFHLLKKKNIKTTDTTGCEAGNAASETARE